MTPAATCTPAARPARAVSMIPAAKSRPA